MDEAPLVELKERNAQAAAAAFRAMADRILLNKDGTFGGAVVIIPPEGGGAPVDLFLLTQQPPGLFWASLQVMVKTALEELDRQDRQGRPYGR
jgi:hypothetical protein